MIRDLDDKELGFLLVTSSLSPFLCRFFFVTSFGALLSASYWLPLFPLERLGELDCWSSHRWCGVDYKRSCHRLVRVVLVERTDELSKILDC